MSRILLAWELGAGFGHLAPFLSLAPGLLERGHELHIAAREISGTCKAIGELPIIVHQAPLCLNSYGGLQEPPLNYAEILMRYGYLDAAMLRAMLAAWRSLLHATGTDVLIADHAPTALLAARVRRVPCAVIGGPFNLPPDLDPTPNMRPWVAVPPQRLADSDRRVLEVINSALPADAAIDALYRIFEGAVRLLSGVPELDPYGARNPESYLGLWALSTGSAEPEWPPGEGARVFAYLHPSYRHLERALQSLATCGAQVLAYVYGGGGALAQRHSGPNLHFSPHPLDVRKVVADCALCVCHGSSGTTLGMLSGGVPTLVLPMHLENFLLGQRVAQAGAGQVVHPDVAEPDIAGTLAEMLATPAFGVKARQLAAQCAGATVGKMTHRAVARIDALAAKAAGPQK